MGKAYYNEFDPKKAAWLRELIKANLIAPGDVDERSIKDVRADDLRGYTQCHFFAGIGVWSYSLRQAGWEDDREVWTGSCPCQPFSSAGKQVGFNDERHLWPAWFNLICERKPGVIFGEQVSSSDGLKWIDLVSDDLESADYAVGALDICAASVGAPHIRQRLYWVADSAGKRGRWRHTLEEGEREELRGSSKDLCTFPWPDHSGSSSTLSVADILSPSYGTSARMVRLRGYGDGLVAPQAVHFIKAYLEVSK